MKKLLLLLMVIALSLIPTAPALAQDDSVSPDCDPLLVLTDLQFMFEDVASLDEFVEVLGLGGLVVFQCYEDWLTLLLDFAMEEFGGGAVPLPIPQPAPDDSGDSADGPATRAGSLTARDAEAAIQAAFAGDIDLANEFLCASEQFDASEGEAFPDDLQVNEVSCQRLGDVMNCTFSITSDAMGGDVDDELSFEIVDELLCTTLE